MLEYLKLPLGIGFYISLFYGIGFYVALLLRFWIELNLTSQTRLVR